MSLRESLKTVQVTDGTIAVLDAGEGSPVVLLHGGALDHRMWQPQIDVLRSTHRVVAIDARGHGASSSPTTPFMHARDVAAVLEQLDIASATLVGLSMGASTALDTALAYPALVEAMVISGAGASSPEFVDPWVLDIFMTWHEAQQQGDAQKWLESFLLFVSGPHRELAQVDNAIVDHVRDLAEHTMRTHVPSGMPILPEWVPGAAQRLGEIDVPVLGIAGGIDADDHVRMTTEAAAAVPHGRMVIIDGTAHYPNLEQPAQFNELLRDFLTQVV